MTSTARRPLSRVLLAGLSGLVGVLLLLVAPPGEDAAGTTPVSEGTYGPTKLTLKGGWKVRAVPANLSHSSASLSGAGSAQLVFRSTGVSWVTATNDYSGTATVYLDGTRKKTVDLYSASTRYQQTVYRAAGLRNGVHTLQVVRTGKKNAKSHGSSLTVDAFTVPDVTAPLAPAAATAKAGPAGTALAWTPSRSTDVAGYRVYRQQGTAGTRLVGATGAGVPRWLDDDATAPGATYRYSVVGYDRAGNVSPAATVSLRVPATPVSARYRYAGCPAATVEVGSQSALVAALAGAGPGTVIRVAAGRYWGTTTVTVHGSAERPVWVCGSRDAVFQQSSNAVGVGFKVESSSHLVLAGMTVRTSAKGVTVTASDHVTVADLKIEGIGEEAVHVMGSTTDSTVVGNTITGTGLVHPQYGEGIYIGTDKSNWCRYNECRPDLTAHNAFLANMISGTTAEGIEAKELTADTVLAGNTIDGARTTVANASSTLIKVKGNRFTVRDNTLSSSSGDAVLVLKTLDGTGQDDVVLHNTFGGRIPGYGVRVSTPKLGTVVGCDNSGRTGLGLSNQACQR